MAADIVEAAYYRDPKTNKFKAVLVEPWGSRAVVVECKHFGHDKADGAMECARNMMKGTPDAPIYEQF